MRLLKNQCRKNIQERVKRKRMTSKNNSSTFYGEDYHQKQRKKLMNEKRRVYREKHKEFFDQDSELEILKYYKNLTKRCQMSKYFQILSQVYLKFKNKHIKNNEDFNNSIKQFEQEMDKAIKSFHRDLMCKDYITREQYISLNLHSYEETCDFWKNLEAKQPNKEKAPGDNNRVETCNKCPIFVEEFEFNFEKSIDVVKRSCQYWDQLNGHQKANKIRSHMEQTLKVLQYELERKCEYSLDTSPLRRQRRPRYKRRRVRNF